jgi:hypothetical protein
MLTVKTIFLLKNVSTLPQLVILWPCEVRFIHFAPVFKSFRKPSSWLTPVAELNIIKVPHDYM